MLTPCPEDEVSAHAPAAHSQCTIAVSLAHVLQTQFFGIKSFFLLLVASCSSVITRSVDVAWFSLVFYPHHKGLAHHMVLVV